LHTPKQDNIILTYSGSFVIEIGFFGNRTAKRIPIVFRPHDIYASKGKMMEEPPAVYETSVRKPR